MYWFAVGWTCEHIPCIYTIVFWSSMSCLGVCAKHMWCSLWFVFYFVCNEVQTRRAWLNMIMIFGSGVLIRMSRLIVIAKFVMFVFVISDHVNNVIRPYNTFNISHNVANRSETAHYPPKHAHSPIYPAMSHRSGSPPRMQTHSSHTHTHIAPSSSFLQSHMWSFTSAHIVVVVAINFLALHA